MTEKTLPTSTEALGDALQPEPTTPLPEAPEALYAREIKGPKGPEPTRFGDWERKGRCVDF